MALRQAQGACAGAVPRAARCALSLSKGAGPSVPMSLSRSCRVSTPIGLPSSSTSSASPSTSTSTALATGSVAPSIGSGSSIAELDRSAGRACRDEQGAEQPALADRADHLGRHHRRLGPDHRHLRSRRTRAGSTRPRRWSRSGGCAPAWAARRTSPAARRRPPARSVYARGEAVAAQPGVVEDLAEVAAARVGQQHHDHRVRVVDLAGPAGPRRPWPSRRSRRPAAPPRGPAAGSWRRSRRRRPR